MKKAIVALALIAGASQASAAIVNGKHDFNVQLSTQRTAAAIADGQTCVYCHTPHNAATQLGAPLWNRNLPGAGTYTLYNQALLNGTLQTLGINSQTCLSCHDGTADIGVVLNGAKRTTSNVTAGSFGAIYNIGTSLSNDHPVAVPYPASGTFTADFVDRATVNGLGTTQIRLYQGALATVECGTCHDPHVSATTRSFFLRISSQNSQICTTCHIR